ncbi:MAG: bifunctional phosphopantothenoylcysteine decarboxylase/phosphopantothenate--cysteine ligase CoaBC [Thermodesulfobacteriota bacterium]|nr:bifunctional phosphopantothenoylcysteine decarboxylase/phosphopantothenate--cysteine ligase CoaBC [Thermodesulfobacteriota bacterium]
MGNKAKGKMTSPIENKKIILGITGGIAAYKAPLIARLLKLEGADVYTIMTEAAANFVTPLTMQVLTNRPVYTQMFANNPTGIPLEISHISLADLADLMVIAPATANFIAKMAHGIADDILSATVLATQAQLLVCPSMNVNMLENKATQDNISILRSRGVHILDPDSGELACGWEGKGRLPEPERIVAEVQKILSLDDFSEINILITSGPTLEDIDPIRFITNRSTGKMGAAIVEAACLRGARVKVITGPVDIQYAPWARIAEVRSAKEMLKAVQKNITKADVLIMAAAVGDYAPASYSKKKIKKGKDVTLKLELSTDILSSIKDTKGGKIFVGFAAETDNISEYGRKKLDEKGLDLIVANIVGRQDTGFKSDTNTGIIISSSGIEERFEDMPKKMLAHKILDCIKERIS